MSLTFVIGGARSGKTAYAMSRALSRPAQRRVMIATAQALDEEMAARIARHRQDRGADWETVEEPLALADAVLGLLPGDVAVIDCLTLWLSNLLLGDIDVASAVQALCDALTATPADVTVVSNEVGQGIVPDNPLARRFRDEAGWMHQAV
ncbi:MAG TPA: bifunctional adenosylcobinamide kinase/adenosylcobinamide-phosphate guanylyltransferase, partial [Phenylobacterium sp.]